MWKNIASGKKYNIDNYNCWAFFWVHYTRFIGNQSKFVVVVVVVVVAVFVIVFVVVVVVVVVVVAFLLIYLLCFKAVQKRMKIAREDKRVEELENRIRKNNEYICIYNICIERILFSSVTVNDDVWTQTSKKELDAEELMNISKIINSKLQKC